MAGFKASERLTKLDYHFGEYSPDPNNPLTGTIPEPSRRAVIEYNDAMAKGLESIGKKPNDPTDQVEIMRIFDALTVEELWQINDHVMDAITTVTANNPAREDLELLGNRAQMTFREWLSQELNRPEAPTPGTRN